MKKSDILIISIVFMLILSLVFINTLNNKDEYTIQLIVNNEYIDTIYFDNDCEYEIKSNNNFIYIYKNDVLIKTIDSKKEIYNKIIVNDGVIIMKDANCVGRDCTRMHLSKDYLRPIICTNNVIVKIEYQKQDVDITT